MKKNQTEKPSTKPSNLAIVILGEANSGKSTVLKKLFHKNIKTAWQQLNLRNQLAFGDPTLKTDVLVEPFVIYGSPTENTCSIKKTFSKKKLKTLPKILIVASQYGPDQNPPNDYDPKPTLEFILDHYECVHILWLNPGFRKTKLNANLKKPYNDQYGFLDFLLPTAWVRFFASNQHERACQEIRKIVSGFALYH